MVTHTLTTLRQLFTSGVCERDGIALRFRGTLGGFPSGRDDLEKTLGYKIPDDVAEFLREFGGTELFLNEHGVGFRVLRLDEIARVNRELQESTEPYWPRFAVVAFDRVDDMMCLHYCGDEVHFGNLHHEAWGEPDCWAKEAMTYAPFQSWLEMFVETADAIPGKDISYAI